MACYWCDAVDVNECETPLKDHYKSGCENSLSQDIILTSSNRTIIETSAEIPNLEAAEPDG